MHSVLWFIPVAVGESGNPFYVIYFDWGIMCHIDIHLITPYMCKLDGYVLVNYWVFVSSVIFFLLQYYLMCVFKYVFNSQKLQKE